LNGSAVQHIHSQVSHSHLVMCDDCDRDSCALFLDLLASTTVASLATESDKQQTISGGETTKGSDDLDVIAFCLHLHQQVEGINRT
jgi:hypothetical protein